MITRPDDAGPHHAARLVVRVDADDRIGLGHLVRSFSLAQRWHRSIGSVHFVCAALPEEWRRRLTEAGMGVSSVDEFRDLANSRSVLLVDSYEADTSQLAEGFGAFVAVDDFGVGNRGPGADIVIDQSAIPASPVPGSYRGARRLLRGPRYAMLRPQFDDPPSRAPVSGRLLISLGGRPTTRTLRWSDEVRSELEGDMEIVHLSDVDDVAGLLSSCEMALAAAGSTTWELCRLGVPSVFIAVAENQLGVLETVARCRVGVTLGPLADVAPGQAIAAITALRADGHRLDQLSARAAALVDGKGADRVVTAIRSALLRVRPSEPRDDSLLLVVEDDNRPIGQLRIDVRGDAGHVDLLIGSEVPEGAMAASVIDVGTQAAFERLPHLRRAQAKVLDGDDALARSFTGADYDVELEPPDPGPQWRTFVRRRTDHSSN